jgi:hypothetical protein
MSDGVSFKVRVSRLAGDADAVQRVRTWLADRRQLHAKMAVEGSEFTRDFLRKSGRHATADRLGAQPTGFRARNAKQVAADSNQEEAQILIARSTGLGRAFHDMVIRPGSGKIYLTIPATARTYGKTAGEFKDQLAFVQTIATRTPMLVFTDTGEPAFWLRRKIVQKQDRSLLPTDEDYADMGAISATRYLRNVIQGS